MRLLMHDLDDSGGGGASPFARALDDVLADGEADVACPFIHPSELAPRLASLTRWRLLTDVEAWLTITPNRAARARVRAWWVANRPRVLNLPGLHAKVAVGRRSAMLGSANFTGQGLHGRVEAGVLVDDPAAVAQLRRWFDACWVVAAEPNERALDWAIGSPPPRPVAVGSTVGRPASLGTNPVRAVRRRPESTDGSTAAGSTAGDRVAAALRSRVDRRWADEYFDLLGDLIRTAAVPEGSRQLTTTLVDQDRCIGVNVNNRSALTWRRGRSDRDPHVYYLLPGRYAEQVQADHPADVVLRSRLHEGDEAVPLDLLVARFPPPASFGDPRAFGDQWRAAIRHEVARKQGHSPRGQAKHVGLIAGMAVDPDRRRAVFEMAFGPADLTGEAVT